VRGRPLAVAPRRVARPTPPLSPGRLRPEARGSGVASTAPAIGGEEMSGAWMPLGIQTVRREVERSAADKASRQHWAPNRGVRADTRRSWKGALARLLHMRDQAPLRGRRIHPPSSKVATRAATTRPRRPHPAPSGARRRRPVTAARARALPVELVAPDPAGTYGPACARWPPPEALQPGRVSPRPTSLEDPGRSN
jgi:hypothetical protein